MGIFSRKVTIELTDDGGNIIKKKIDKKEFDRLVQQGAIKKMDEVTAHILDTNRGYYSEQWVIGHQISQEEVDQFGTASGKIFVCIGYKKGEPQLVITKKEIWEQQKRIFEEIDNESAAALKDILKRF